MALVVVLREHGGISHEPDNCGGCGIECRANERCEYGLCLCTSPYLECGDECLDVRFDNANCGDCGVVCDVDGGERCVMGECISGDGVCGTCTDSELCCTNYDMPDPPLECVETSWMQHLEEHCGGCDPCGVGESCENGTCTCPYWFSDYCGDPAVCTDLFTDENCGVCGNVCTGDSECDWMGEDEPGCICEYEMCGDECTDTSRNEDHCGECDHACDAGWLCVSSVCLQPTGDCSASGGCDEESLCCENASDISECVYDWQLQSSTEHCGGCGIQCDLGEICDAGTCVTPPGNTCDDPAEFQDFWGDGGQHEGDFCNFTNNENAFIEPCEGPEPGAEAFFRFPVEMTGHYTFMLSGMDGLTASIYAVDPGNYCDPDGATPLTCVNVWEEDTFDVSVEGAELIFVLHNPSGTPCQEFQMVLMYEG